MQATLGKKYRDKITGFEGVAVARTEYLSGCFHVDLETGDPEKNNKPVHEWLDEERLVEVDAPAVTDDGPKRSPGNEAPHSPGH